MSVEYITVGKLGRTRGLNGEIFITPATDFPKRFLGLKEIYVKSGSQWEIKKIVSIRIIGERPVVKFENINNPEDASRLTNRNLAVSKEEIIVLPDDRFYIFDLVGSKVFDHKEDKLIGEIVDVIQYPANDVYKIKTAEDKTVFCPALKLFVLDVDTDNKKVVINSDGLYSE